MKNVMIRAFGLMAISTSLLACVGADGEVATEEELVSDGSELTLDEKAFTAAAVTPKLVPLVVQLYQDFNYGGDFRKVIENEKVLGLGSGCFSGLGFENATSSVHVRKGPDYDAWVASHDGAKPYVYLFEHNSFGGRRVALEVGGYPDLRQLGFENLASSVQIVTAAQPPADLNDSHETAPDNGRISVILQAYTEPFSIFCGPDKPAGHKMTILRSEWDIGRDYGSAFQDKISRIDIIPGTAYDPTKTFTVYEDEHYQGFHDGFYHSIRRLADLRDYGLDNQISSIHLEY